MADAGTFARNLEGLKPVDHIEKIVLYHDGEGIDTIPNVEGKRGSLRVYANVLGFKDGIITDEMAVDALELFGEYVDEARENPGEHPNIDRLIAIVDEGYELEATIHYSRPRG